MENINPNEKTSQSQNARILDLKNRGHQISDEFVHDARSGKVYKAYFMVV